jgi:hypothetical protein
MSIKNTRHQSVVNRQSDESFSEDHWLKQFEAKLQKTSVQPRGQSLFDQISSIMNTKSKYPSVQVAVDDMMERSGVKAYLNDIKVSQEDADIQSKKTAQNLQTTETKKSDPKLPQVIQDKPSIQRTLENIIKETRGNMSVPAIINRLHSLHSQDISDESTWDDERLIRLVSNYNLQAKTDNPNSYDNFDNLGQGDHSTADSDVDASNTDAFNALLPARI